MLSQHVGYRNNEKVFIKCAAIMRRIFRHLWRGRAGKSWESRNARSPMKGRKRTEGREAADEAHERSSCMGLYSQTECFLSELTLGYSIFIFPEHYGSVTGKDCAEC